MLDLTKLNDGDIVIVTEDLINPNPDRRTKRNWALATTIPKGLKLRVRIKTLHYFAYGDELLDKLREKLGEDITKDTPWRYELEPLGGGYGTGLSYDREGKIKGIGTDLEQKTDKLAMALLEVLAPLDDLALGDLLRQKGMIGKHQSNQCGELLAILLDHGKVDISDVRMAITVLDGIDYDNGDWERFEKKHSL